MKLADMADLLDGLATMLEKHLGKTEVKDLREVGACFQKFPNDTVAGFCSYIIQAREGKPAPKRSGAGADHEAKMVDLVARIQHYRAHHREYEYSAIRALAAEVGKLTAPNVKSVGQKVGCALTGTKPQMILRLEQWLLNLKSSADQASFSLSAAGTT